MKRWLIDIREKFEYTQETVADLSQISRSMYAMIEQGRRDPSVAVAKRIADVLQFDWTLFFEESSHKTCNESKRDTA